MGSYYNYMVFKTVLSNYRQQLTKTVLFKNRNHRTTANCQIGKCKKLTKGRRDTTWVSYHFTIHYITLCGRWEGIEFTNTNEQIPHR